MRSREGTASGMDVEFEIGELRWRRSEGWVELA